MRRISLRLLVGLALVITGDRGLDAQAQASRSDQRLPLAFEVASVKEIAWLSIASRRSGGAFAGTPPDTSRHPG